MYKGLPSKLNSHPACLPCVASARVLQAVLYGIFPAVLLGAAITYGLTRWQKKPLAKLAAAQATADISTNLRDVYRFTQPTQVMEGSDRWGWGQQQFCTTAAVGPRVLVLPVGMRVDWCGTRVHE